jgi:hypothetical protein
VEKGEGGGGMVKFRKKEEQVKVAWKSKVDFEKRTNYCKNENFVGYRLVVFKGS